MNFNSTLSSFADLEASINSLSIRVVIGSAIALVVLTLVAIALKNKNEKAKLPLFVLMFVAIVGSTATLLISTVYLNVKSDSGGPVHWHTDFEIWACGNELELRNPSGFLSNKIGTATYHEHNDKRIHLEGVVVDKEYDASLEKFMEVVGGSITKDSITVPLADSIVEEVVDGDKVESIDRAMIDQYLTNDIFGKKIFTAMSGNYCGDEQAQVQAFVYTYNKDNDTYSQKKLEEPEKYVLRDESVVPPADCLIIEFDTPKDKTDKLCEQYGIRDEKRCVEFGVKSFNPDLCNINEVDATTGGNE